MCVHMHKIHSEFYRPAKRHKSEAARDAAVERTRHPAQEKSYGCGSDHFLSFPSLLTDMYFLPSLTQNTRTLKLLKCLHNLEAFI